MAKKTCGQVNIPKVDNTLMICDQIVVPECMIIDRVSPLVQNVPGETLDQYLARLDNLIYTLIYRISELEIKTDENGDLPQVEGPKEDTLEP